MAEIKKAAPTTTFSAKDIEENKVLAGLSYLWLLSIIMLLVKKESPFVQFHAKQGLVLFIASIICAIIPIVGWMASIVVIVFVIMGLVNALSGKAYQIPLVYKLASKINF